MKNKYIIYLITIFFIFSGCRSKDKKKDITLNKEAKNKTVNTLKSNEDDKNVSLPSNRENIVFKDINGFPEYVIGPKDIITLTIWRKSGSDVYDVSVRPDGKISFLLLDDVPVSGYTLSELDVILTAKLKNYFKDPRIDITIKEYNSKYVYVLGEIVPIVGTAQSGPGRYPLKEKTFLIDLILKAGGLSNMANLSEVKISREGKTYKKNLIETIFKGKLDNQILLESKDVIVIPSKEDKKETENVVYVIGDVKKPGIFKYTGKIGVIKALTMAGGYNATAVDEAVKVIRGDINDPVLLSANIEKYFDDFDLKENIAIESGDIVYVPNKVIKDINNFFKQIQPILQAILYPGLFRDLYTTGGGMRIDTGEVGTGGITVLPSR